MSSNRYFSGGTKTTVLESVGSTNSWLFENYVNLFAGNDTQMLVCAAEHQTAGRGRRGKQWHSPDQGVTFSLCFTLPVALAGVGGLSLLAGASICEWLWQNGIETAKIKWPNDVLVNNAKLVGILVEVAAHTQNSTTLIVGIGVNYRRGKESAKIDQASTDLYELMHGAPVDRSVLIGQLAVEVYRKCSAARVPDTLSQLAETWSQYDALVGAEITIGSNDTDSISGRGDGIDPNGQLKLVQGNRTLLVASGDVSVRRRP